MQGRRYPDVPDTRKPHERMEPGGYRRIREGEDGRWVWEAVAPNGLIGNLTKHEITEHEDGRITVFPSILAAFPPHETWHGYLERGVWRDA